MQSAGGARNDPAAELQRNHGRYRRWDDPPRPPNSASFGSPVELVADYGASSDPVEQKWHQIPTLSLDAAPEILPDESAPLYR